MPLALKIILSVVVIELLGFASGFSTMSSIKTWYAELQKPPGTPPNWIFGPVWTFLYTLMGISFALIWHKAPSGTQKNRALLFFAVQMILNLIWTPIFFGMHQIGGALLSLSPFW